MARTSLCYGESGTFKTSNLGYIADYLSDLTNGGIVRMVTSDSGFTPVRDQVRRGVIYPWLISSAKMPLACLKLASEGYWPTELDVITGIANEESLRMTTKKEWNHVAAYLIEGLYMIGTLVSEYLMTQQRATGEPLTAVFQEAVGGLTVDYSDSSRGTYKFVQNRTFGYVNSFKALPCHDCVFTSHESKGEDSVKSTIYGPAVVGKALTNKVSGWFENTFHFDSYTYKDEVTGIDRAGARAFFERHLDPEVPNVWWPAKLGVEPETKAKVLKVFSKGCVPLVLDSEGNSQCDLSKVFAIMDEREIEERKGLKVVGA